MTLTNYAAKQTKLHFLYVSYIKTRYTLYVHVYITYAVNACFRITYKSILCSVKLNKY